MKSKKPSHVQSVIAHIVLILLAFYVPVLLLYSDYQCDSFSC